MPNLASASPPLIPRRAVSDETRGRAPVGANGVEAHFAALLFGILIPAGDQAKRMKDQLRKEPVDDSTLAKTHRQKLSLHHKVAKDILASVAYSIEIALLNVLLLIFAFCSMPQARHREPLFYPWLLGLSAYLFAIPIGPAHACREVCLWILVR